MYSRGFPAGSPEPLTHIFKWNIYVNSIFTHWKRQLLSCGRPFATPRTVAHQALLFLNSLGKNTSVGNHSLLQRIFPTEWSPQVFWIGDKFFTKWDTREALYIYIYIYTYTHIFSFYFRNSICFTVMLFVSFHFILRIYTKALA